MCLIAWLTHREPWCLSVCSAVKLAGLSLRLQSAQGRCASRCTCFLETVWKLHNLPTKRPGSGSSLPEVCLFFFFSWTIQMMLQRRPHKDMQPEIARLISQCVPKGAEKKKKSEQSVPIYSCFYLTMHAGHDPIHIEEYRFVFAFKYFLTLISYIYLPLPFSGSPLQIISAHSEWKNCMHSKGH